MVQHFLYVCYNVGGGGGGGRNQPGGGGLENFCVSHPLKKITARYLSSTSMQSYIDSEKC